MMNVRIRLTRKRAKCRYCGKYVKAGEYQVVCTYFMKLKYADKTWMKMMIFHAKDPYCWIEQGIASVKMKPHVETRGRKRKVLDDESRVIRLKLLRQRANLMRRLRTEIYLKRRSGRIALIVDMMERLKEEIVPYGGVPKLWEQEKTINTILEEEHDA